MSLARSLSAAVVLALAAGGWNGCGHKHDEHDEHDEHHGHEEAEHKDHDHEEPSQGAKFEPGKGIYLSEATRRSLGLEVATAALRKMPLEIRFSAQVFGEDHHASAAETYHADCTAKAAGLMAREQAESLRPGQFAKLVARNGEAFGGFVLGVHKALAIGDVEALVGITNSRAQLRPGDFLRVTVPVARDKEVLAVPASAVLRSAEGTFVYAVNGDAFLRREVKTGADADGFIEVADGLTNGEEVVTVPVEKLWLIELRATKGGGHSH